LLKKEGTKYLGVICYTVKNNEFLSDKFYYELKLSIREHVGKLNGEDLEMVEETINENGVLKKDEALKKEVAKAIKKE